MIAYIPLICAIVGVLLYVLASNPKVQEIGRLAYFAGFLVLMFTLASKTVHFLAK